MEDGIDVSENDYVDTRLDHTVARPGIMFLDVQLYDWTPREATVYGPYSPKKRIVSKNSSYYLAIWPYVNALNVYIIRYADVLLWRAEAAIELGDLTTGLKYINQVRERAMNSQTVKTARRDSGCRQIPDWIISVIFRQRGGDPSLTYRTTSGIRLRR